MADLTDILIIGAGITGCAVARELSRYQASITVLEQADDVAEGATKANSGIVHAGYDALPGTKKAEYNVRGALLYPSLCCTLHIPYKQNGALVIALSEEERKTTELLKERGCRNGVPGIRILEHDEVLSLEPSLNPAVICALYIPGSAIISPYEAAFAFADDAALNGVTFRFHEKVIAVSRLADGTFSVRTKDASIRCRALVNCAGASGAEIHNQLSHNHLRMIYRRGQYYLLDRSSEPPFTRTVFQCPSVMGKGVLVSPTVHGNLILGPNAEDIDVPDDTATTGSGLAEVLEKASRTWPGLSVRSNITNFSGVRAHLTDDDFVIGPCADCPGLFDAVGIESPGLSSAPAIGQDIAEMVAVYLNLECKTSLIPYSVPLRPFQAMTDTEREEAVRSDPAFGNIVCRCETVTEAEIRAAIRRPVGARSVDAVKRRTRAGMGRCQGGFCMPRVAEILSEETGIPLREITKNGGHSYILSDTIGSFLKEITDDE
jgi:glycerol-3-phosphate dehydrogenase